MKTAPFRPVIKTILMSWVVWILVGQCATVDAQLHDERAVRAAYVFNLLQFVEWPPDKHDLLLGVLGGQITGDVFGKMLEGKKVDGRTIHVRLARSDEELRLCDIVYFADAETSRPKSVLTNLRDSKILTIGEANSFAQDGGIVGLVKEDEHIQIQVNIEAAQHARVSISSHVLNLAVIVRPAHKGKN